MVGKVATAFIVGFIPTNGVVCSKSEMFLVKGQGQMHPHGTRRVAVQSPSMNEFATGGVMNGQLCVGDMLGG